MTKDIGWNVDTSYARLPQSFYSKQDPTPVKAPKLIRLNKTVAEDLGLDQNSLQSEEGIAILAGNTVPDGATSLAQAYAGHQFGHFNMLGDGRAVLISEHKTPKGERVDVQLKGSGRTRYSRGGDGRAALGPMLREYIISEAMHALGIPTTRSLAVVTTGEDIIRETDLPGAILTRIASSHIRVGTFQYAAQFTEVEELRALADYTIKRHYPEVENEEKPYFSLLQEVINRQAALIAKWQMVGFIHGVMNTDNMTISGETIDYGPCAFMNTYDPEAVFSSIDRQGRYAYGNQPYIGGWNLARFAESLIPLLHEDQDQAVEIAQSAISEYSSIYHEHWLSGMRSKLGLFNEEEGDKALAEELLSIMHKQKADFTNTFQSLTRGTDLPNSPEFQQWKERWEERQSRQSESKEASHELMRKSNPVVIPRNHRVEEALEAAVEGDLSVMERLLDVLADPYNDSDKKAKYCELPPDSSVPYKTYCGT